MLTRIMYHALATHPTQDGGNRHPPGNRPRRQRPRGDRHGRRLLRPHAHAAGQARRAGPEDRGPAATCTSISITRSRTSASVSAWQCGRRWATGPASAATGTSPCRWTRRWPPARSISAGGPTSSFRPNSPPPKIGDFQSELVADFWHAFAVNVLGNVHIQVPYGRNGHHIAEGIFKSAARALRMALEPDRANHRRAQHQGRAVAARSRPRRGSHGWKRNTDEFRVQSVFHLWLPTWFRARLVFPLLARRPHSLVFSLSATIRSFFKENTHGKHYRSG